MLALSPVSALHEVHMPYNQHLMPAVLPLSCARQGHLKQFKPKLSLDTSVTSPISAAYKSSTDLRLDSLSVISPTSRNTLHNTTLLTDPTRTPLSEVPRYSPCPVSIRVSSPRDSARSSSPQRSSYTVLRSPGSPSSPRRDLPLDTVFRVRKLPGRSALKTTKTLTMARSPVAAQEKKRVAFRAALTETIETNTYIVAHSELLLSPGVDRSVMMLPSPTFPTGNAHDVLSTNKTHRPSPLPFSTRTETRTESRWKAAIEAATLEAGVRELERAASVPVKRGSTSSEEGDTDADDACPSVVVVSTGSRKKRVRRWQQSMRGDDSE